MDIYHGYEIYYDLEVVEKLKKSLTKGIIDFLTSDMHNVTSRPSKEEKRLGWVRKRLSPAYQRKLLCYNGRDILPENLENSKG